MQHNIKAKNLKQIILEQEIEDLDELGLGHHADLVNQELKHVSGHYVHLNHYTPEKIQY